MRVIELRGCKKCTSLPPLGKLPGLEEIRIGSMAGILRVGEEFYGKKKGSFPSLKILKFEDLENWSEWSHPAGCTCHFASLQELVVSNCPKLSLSLPDVINVQKLKVRKCDKLLVAVPRQSILEMDIEDCKLELVARLKKDEDASQLLPSVASSLIMERVGDLPQMMMLGSLTVLAIERIPKLTHLPGVVVQGLPKLETLKICYCEELTSLWKMNEIGRLSLRQHFLNSLRVLEVKECCQLVCLVTQGSEEDDADRDTDISGEKEEEKRGKQQCLGLPCGLHTLRLKKCEKLEKLPNDLHNLTSLRKLQIFQCPKLEPSWLHNLTSLSELKISLCCKLEKLTGDSHDLSSLSRLKMWRCWQLGKPASWLSPSGSEVEIWGCDRLPSGLHNLTSLSELKISDCDNLEKLSSELHNLTSLRRLLIANCGELSCLWEMGFPSTMESLDIRGCELLTCLSPSPSSSSHSLKDLDIRDCKNLESLVATADSFPSLESLVIRDCPKLKSLPEDIHRRLEVLEIGRCQNLVETLRISGSLAGLLSNLRQLEIDAPMTPDDDEQLFSVPLPSSLINLSISNFKKLSPEAFRNLTSLQYLSISECPELTSIPEQLLPPSLLSLEISGCPLLAPDFAEGKGRYWPKLKFIPHFEFHHRSISDSDAEEVNESDSFNRWVGRNCC